MMARVAPRGAHFVAACTIGRKNEKKKPKRKKQKQNTIHEEEINQ